MVLAFDVKVEREAQEIADSVGVKIFTADIIYHLFDAFTAYRDVSAVPWLCALCSRLHSHVSLTAHTAQA